MSLNIYRLFRWIKLFFMLLILFIFFLLYLGFYTFFTLIRAQFLLFLKYFNIILDAVCFTRYYWLASTLNLYDSFICLWDLLDFFERGSLFRLFYCLQCLLCMNWSYLYTFSICLTITLIFRFRQSSVQQPLIVWHEYCF